MSKRIGGFLLTGFLLVAVVFLLSLSSRPGEFLAGFNSLSLLVLSIFPILILLGNSLLMIYFNSTRLFFMNWLLMLTYLYYLLPALTVNFNFVVVKEANILKSALLYSYFIPPVFFIIHLTSERGYLSPTGLIKFIISVASACLPLVYFIFEFPTVRLIYGHLPAITIGALEISSIFILIIFSFCLALIFIRERSFYGQGQEIVFWAVVAVCLAPLLQENSWAGQPFPFPPAVAVLYSFGGVVMAGRVINYAWGKAYLDKLTLVGGRLALDEHLDRLSGNYALAMVDIDNFKTFNDKYGHDSGDVVLQQVADILDYYSSGDVYRFGGEEFTVVYPDESAAEVEEELEDLRLRVAKNKVGVTRKSKRATKVLKKKVTVSIGLAAAGERYENAHEVLNAADNALYRAKNEGRNRLCIK
ncbi:MAG: GGDEF domain-containing protein [bacterium]